MRKYIVSINSGNRVLKMNCRTFEYIVTVQETGSVAEAAKRCNVTSGTISGQITKLEDYLGIKVFEDRTSPVRLNQKALALYEHIHNVVENVRSIRQLSRSNPQRFTLVADNYQHVAVQP